MRIAMYWSRPTSSRTICQRSFATRVRIEGPNQSRRSIDGEPISDADKMRPGAKQEDYGFTFGASKSWRETFADAAGGKIRRRIKRA